MKKSIDEISEQIGSFKLVLVGLWLMDRPYPLVQVLGIVFLMIGLMA